MLTLEYLPGEANTFAERERTRVDDGGGGGGGDVAGQSPCREIEEEERKIL